MLPIPPHVSDWVHPISFDVCVLAMDALYNEFLLPCMPFLPFWLPVFIEARVNPIIAVE
jgi:hypothetical protein